jgi:hypothetical protein
MPTSVSIHCYQICYRSLTLTNRITAWMTLVRSRTNYLNTVACMYLTIYKVASDNLSLPF